MAARDWPNLDGDTQNKIVMDVTLGVAPENSERVVYGHEELAFRKDFMADLEEMKKENPDVVIDVRE